MIDEIVAKRYAEAFVGYAEPTIGKVRAVDELGEVKRLVRDTDELRAFLESGDITPSEKFALIDTAFARMLSEETITFLKLLIDHQRINRLADIAEYARMKYAHGDEIDALLKTSYPLDTDVIARIKTAVEHGAQGVGLYRTEYLFLNRKGFPTEDEQFTAYSNVARGMKPHEVKELLMARRSAGRHCTVWPRRGWCITRSARPPRQTPCCKI